MLFDGAWEELQHVESRDSKILREVILPALVTAANVRAGIEQHYIQLRDEFLRARRAKEEAEAEGWEAPRILPPIWEEADRSKLDGSTRYECASLKLRAILSCSIEPVDKRAWLHLSVSHKSRIPKWTELAEAKRVFLGNREAYQVLPPKERYVNINARVLHLFALLDEKATALPDFTRGTGSL
jgi:hypothetical protein